MSITPRARRVCFSLLLLSMALGRIGHADETEMQTVRLPEKLINFTTAGAGRYIATQFESDNRVAVYDIESGEVAFELDQVAKGDLLAGSAEKLVVISPGKMMIRRWDLASGKRDKLALLKSDETPRKALLGPSGNGPLLVIGTKDLQWIDIDTLKPLTLDGPKFASSIIHGSQEHVSAGGLTFTQIPTGYGPVGYTALHLRGERIQQVRFGSTSNAIRWAQPSGNGYLLMLPGGEIFTGNGRKVEAEWLAGAAMIASNDPSYILKVRVDHREPSGEAATQLTVCSTSDCRPLMTEVGFPELVPARINSWHDIVNSLRMGNEWRLIHAAEVNKLVTLPNSNDELIIRPFDITQKLGDSELDYLYVASQPPLRATAGTTLQYDIDVHGKAKKFGMELADGPADAKLRKGRLSWKVPADYADPWARFLVSISNKNGEEIFHSFEVAVDREDEAK